MSDSTSDLLQNVFETLQKNNLMLVTAESCTGGLIAKTITDIAGSSRIFDRGFVTYSNQAKIDLLGVYASTLDAYGAVSHQVAEMMADGALRQSGAQISVAVTGIAGPDGGTPEKPVGLVYIAVAMNGKSTRVVEHHFDGTRTDIRNATMVAAFQHILDMIKL